ASILRGSGNMLLPGVVLAATSLLQIGLGGLLTFGIGPLPELGIRGPATALVIAFGLATLVLGACVASGISGVHLKPRTVRLRARHFMEILKVGAVACGLALLTISTVLIVTRLVASLGPAALAGFGLGSRLELMLVPLAFGIGGAMTASVGINFGAHQYARARRIAWTGGLLVGLVTTAIGLIVALHPPLWLSHFTSDADAYRVGAHYLRIVGPLYGFFGMGMALYFATQGTGNMIGPCIAGCLRILVAAGGGALLVKGLGLGAGPLFGCVAAGLCVFGTTIAGSLFTKVWHVERKSGRPPDTGMKTPVGP
ncbi:MAG: MATE family efflux transporter, partial [Gammaproteobacteria bacterium]|nr:MATE family efflux transporter [Gammaproteobacteria bacterium]